MPTSAITTFSGKKLEPFYRPDLAREQAVKLPASVTLARGTMLGEKSATPGTFGAYASGNSDGTERCKGILAFDCVSNASGKIAHTTDGTTGELGEVLESTPAYFGGIFKTSELTGLDENALEDLGGKLISGTLADGVIEF